MQAAERRRARVAAMSTASALGLAVDDAVVLSDSNRLVVRLTPCDVVARIAPVGYRVFSAAVGAERELEVVRRLAETDGPVAVLEPRVEPRVFVRDGFDIAMLTYYEPAQSRELPPNDYARARASSRRHATGRCRDIALHGSSRRRSTLGCTSRRHSGSRRRGSGASRRHARESEAVDRRPARRRAAAARRAPPVERARHEEGAALHRLRELCPRAGRVRSWLGSHRGQRALSGR